MLPEHMIGRLSVAIHLVLAAFLIWLAMGGLAPERSAGGEGLARLNLVFGIISLAFGAALTIGVALWVWRRSVAALLIADAIVMPITVGLGSLVEPFGIVRFVILLLLMVLAVHGVLVDDSPRRAPAPSPRRLQADQTLMVSSRELDPRERPWRPAARHGLSAVGARQESDSRPEKSVRPIVENRKSPDS